MGKRCFNQSPAVPGGFVPGPAGDIQRRQVEDFLFAFDSNLAPIVGQQTTLTQENLAGVRIVRAFRQEEAEVGRFAKLNEEYLEKNMRLAQLYGLMQPGFSVFAGLGMVAVIGAGNTAVDAVTQAKRLGAERVIMVYRKTAPEMPATSGPDSFFRIAPVAVSK